MKKIDNTADNMKKEYDFSNGVRGKYAKKYEKGTNIIVLDPDIAKIFHDSASVNETLRAIAKIAIPGKRKPASPAL